LIGQLHGVEMKVVRNLRASEQAASGNLPSKLVVGLIGGIGSGKSLVAAAMARHGARVVAGDRLGHEALLQPHLRDQVVRRWGRQVLDASGAVDRQKLGAIVFADPRERRALEALSFPWIEWRLGEEVAAAAADPGVPLIVVDAAILLEAGWNKWCDRIVYVHAPRHLRLQRVAGQRGWSAKEVEARERAQFSLTDKVRRAEVAVDNSGSPEETARQVDDLLRRWGLPVR
jgi:dephospho-CoA kinase